MSRKTRGCDACCLDSEKFNPKTTQELPLTLVSIRARRVRVGFISFKDGKFYDNLYSVQNARCVLMQKWFETLWRFGGSEARYFMTATISSPHTSCRYQILLPCLCKAPCKISFVLFSLKFDEVSQ